MLRVTVELIPHGDETKKTILNIINIINDGTGTSRVGNYKYEVIETESIGEGLMHFMPIDNGVVCKHSRIGGALKLITRVLRTHQEHNRCIH